MQLIFEDIENRFDLVSLNKIGVYVISEYRYIRESRNLCNCPIKGFVSSRANRVCFKYATKSLSDVLSIDKIDDTPYFLNKVSPVVLCLNVDVVKTF